LSSPIDVRAHNTALSCAPTPCCPLCALLHHARPLATAVTPRQRFHGQEDSDKPCPTGTIFNLEPPHACPSCAGLAYRARAQWPPQRCPPRVVHLVAPDRPSYRPRARAPIYPPPHRTSCPPMSPPSSFTGKAVCRSPIFSPSQPPWTGCLTASCLPFLGPTEAPQCGSTRGPAGDTFPSPERRRVGAAPPPSPALGEILPHLLFRLELVLRCLPHPPLTVQDLSELQFTLAGRRNRCATPSMLVSRTPLPHLLVGHFVSSKRGPALAR
jgi:hypothetical protein